MNKPECVLRQAEYWLMLALVGGVLALLIGMDEVLRRLHPRVIYVHSGDREQRSDEDEGREAWDREATP